MVFDFASIRSGFFDTEKVRRSVSAGARRVLSKFGAFIRTRARSSIKRPGKKQKKANAVSPPGSPPLAHTGLIKLIFFAYDAATESVVCGPIKLTGKSGRVPTILEQGGDTVISGTAKRKPRRATIAARPFMGPALEAERPKFADQLKNLMR